MSIILLEQPRIAPTGAPLVDRHGRQITYLRVSVTDRCDFRCVYCMAEDMRFLPKRDVLSFEEIDTIVSAFVARGVRKVRLTGGEPLVRRDIMRLVETIGPSRHGLDELTLTSNGSQLARYAAGLVAAGVRRVNVSLDTLDADRFAAITRRGRLADVLAGIEAAAAAGLRIKINMVAMRGINEDEIEPMLRWAHGRGFGLTLIEGMPLGRSHRPRRHLPALRALATGSSPASRSSPPRIAPAVRRATTTCTKPAGLLGFITPMSHNPARAATAYASPPPASSIASARRTVICARPASAGGRRSTPPSTMPWKSSPRATTSCSTATIPGRRWPAT